MCALLGPWQPAGQPFAIYGPVERVSGTQIYTRHTSGGWHTAPGYVADQEEESYPESPPPEGDHRERMEVGYIVISDARSLVGMHMTSRETYRI